MNCISYSSYVIIVGLWGGPYLTHVHGYGLTARGELLMLPAIGTDRRRDAVGPGRTHQSGTTGCWR